MEKWVSGVEDRPAKLFLSLGAEEERDTLSERRWMAAEEVSQPPAWQCWRRVRMSVRDRIKNVVEEDFRRWGNIRKGLTGRYQGKIKTKAQN